MFIYLGETWHASGEGAESEGHTEFGSRLWAVSGGHRAHHGARAHQRNHEITELKWLLNQLSHPGVPGSAFKYLALYIILFSLHSMFIFFNLFFEFIYSCWERHRQRRVGNGQRERGRQRIPGRLCAVSAEPNAGLEPRKTVRSWPERKPRVRRLTDWATQAPLRSVLKKLWILFFMKAN